MYRAQTSVKIFRQLIMALLVSGLLFCPTQSFAEEVPRLAQGLVNQRVDTVKKDQKGFGWNGGWILSRRQPALFVKAKQKTSEGNT
ncbi:MAG TPA: hypothetical protein DDZ90_12880, partial [Planctomycetaceae bacterium]|nr:hypothetical protein [Planctomycetaceae bacterium]